MAKNMGVKSAVAEAVRSEYYYRLTKAKQRPIDQELGVESNKGILKKNNIHKASRRASRTIEARRSLILTNKHIKEPEDHQQQKTVQDLLTKIPFLAQIQHQKLQYAGKATNWYDKEFLAQDLTMELLGSLVAHLYAYL